MNRNPSPRSLPSVLASLAVALLLAALPAGAAEYESAERCRECHRTIYDQWRASLHAGAFTHADFLVPYNRVRNENVARAALCEKCHDPMRALFPKGSAKASSFSPEGVTCDFCHSVEAVESSGPYPRGYTTRPGVKFGPKGDYREKTVHVTRPSTLLKTAEFCAGCHEFRNAYDIPVLSTVTEWEESFYKGERVQCQYCHLPELFDVRFVEGDKTQRKGPADHAMMGGHSKERIARAIPIRATLAATAAGTEVTVKLRNETVGHMTPSGMPHHRLRLVTNLFDEEGKVVATAEERFERVLGDGKGRPLTTPAEFLDAREVIRDNRIKPKEERVVHHTFPAGGGPAPVAAEVVLFYDLPTLEAGPGVNTIEMAVSRTAVTVRTGGYWRTIALAAAGGLGALLLAVLYVLLRRKGSPGGP